MDPERPRYEWESQCNYNVRARLTMNRMVCSRFPMLVGVGNISSVSLAPRIKRFWARPRHSKVVESEIKVSSSGHDSRTLRAKKVYHDTGSNSDAAASTAPQEADFFPTFENQNRLSPFFAVDNRRHEKRSYTVCKLSFIARGLLRLSTGTFLVCLYLMCLVSCMCIKRTSFVFLFVLNNISHIITINLISICILVINCFLIREWSFSDTKMVLAESSLTFQPLMFKGTLDAVWFFFYFEKIAARDKQDKTGPWATLLFRWRW